MHQVCSLTALTHGRAFNAAIACSLSPLRDRNEAPDARRRDTCKSASDPEKNVQRFNNLECAGLATISA